MQLPIYFKNRIPLKGLIFFFPFLFMIHFIYAQTISIKGKVTNERGKSLSGATVIIQGTNKGTITNNKGGFKLTNVDNQATLLISSIGYEKQEIMLNDKHQLTIILHPITNELDETIIRAYGTTTRRLNTGSISKVTAEEIERQPIANPLAALEGRVPGLVVTQSSGVPGSAFKVQIRGKNSLSQGTEPLYIIDGVPYTLNSASLTQITSPIYQSPLNSINPADIESISVLKDADATAIYGSQGANGVILITTKKAKPGKTTLNVNYYTGIGKVTRTIGLLNTSQYIQMRREAFENDGIAPTAATAPDLLSWDTTRYTDWKKKLIGGTAHISNLQASLSAGSETTQFLFSVNHYREKTVFPDAVPAKRSSARLNLSHNSRDRRFKINMNLAYSQDLKKMPLGGITQYIYLPPNAPAVYDSSGKLNWDGWVRRIDNPLRYTLRKYKSETDNLISNAVIQYELFSGLTVKVNAGYNFMELDEQYQDPIKAQRPSATVTGTTQLGTNSMKSWILEPQLNYDRKIGKGKLELLAGLSFQQRKQKGHTIQGTKYTDDDLLGDLTAAGQVNVNNSFSQYNYTAIFGRLNYNWDNKYLININMRRDGSSRFGPAKRFANFSAVGFAWIFSEEDFIQKSLPFLTYGKIRGSYGVTGNDQIGDYGYLDSWSANNDYQYEDVTGILPNKLFNPSFEWERNRKLELALELGIINDRILASVSYYRNRSDNQLVYHNLPSQTGFVTILQNLDALIQNTGWEFELTSYNVNNKYFKWQTNFNLTLPRNKLLKYPGLDISGDKYQYAIDEPLDILFGYEYLGVDAKTGVYQFEDIDEDRMITSPNDLKIIGRVGRNLYGGFQNSLIYKHWQLDIFFQVVKQTGKNYLATLSTIPGAIGNQPTLVLNRWQEAGDKRDIQKFTATASSDAYRAYLRNFRKSSAIIQDASYVRLKNLAFSYSFPLNWISKIHIEELRIYLEAHNLLTFTNYEGADPETQSLLSLPPLKIITAGIQFTL